MDKENCPTNLCTPLKMEASDINRPDGAVVFSSDRRVVESNKARFMSYLDWLSIKDMAGVVLENLSWKKLIILSLILLMLLITFFLIGGLQGKSD